MWRDCTLCSRLLAAWNIIQRRVIHFIQFSTRHMFFQFVLFIMLKPEQCYLDDSFKWTAISTGWVAVIERLAHDMKCNELMSNNTDRMLIITKHRRRWAPLDVRYFLSYYLLIHIHPRRRLNDTQYELLHIISYFSSVLPLMFMLTEAFFAAYFYLWTSVSTGIRI